MLYVYVCIASLRLYFVILFSYYILIYYCIFCLGCAVCAIICKVFNNFIIFILHLSEKVLSIITNFFGYIYFNFIFKKYEINLFRKNNKVKL